MFIHVIHHVWHIMWFVLEQELFLYFSALFPLFFGFIQRFWLQNLGGSYELTSCCPSVLVIMQCTESQWQSESLWPPVSNMREWRRAALRAFSRFSWVSFTELPPLKATFEDSLCHSKDWPILRAPSNLVHHCILFPPFERSTGRRLYSLTRFIAS